MRNLDLNFAKLIGRYASKRLLLSTVGLLALILLAVILPSRFDQSRIKTWLQTKAQQKWSRDLQIAKLQFQLLPRPQFTASDVTLSNPSWAHDRQLFSAKTIHAQFSIWALVSGRLQIQRLAIDGVQAHLEQTTDQPASWDFDTPASAPARPSIQSSVLDTNDLRWLRLTNAEVVYRRSKPGQSDENYEVRVVKLAIDSLADRRQLQLNSHLIHHQRDLFVQGQLDQAANIGQPGAHSPGKFILHAATARLTIDGVFPLDRSLTTGALKLSLSAPAASELLGFIGVTKPSSAAIEASADLRFSPDAFDIESWRFNLGKQALSGSAKLLRNQTTSTINATISGAQLDWRQALVDAGRPLPPAKSAGELFETHTLPWQLLQAVPALINAQVDVHLTGLRLRSGIQLNQVQARLQLHGNQLAVSEFHAGLLNGTAQASAQLDGAQQKLALKLQINNANFEKWFVERGKKSALQGGQFNLNAQVNTAGPSMRQLAANLNGTINFQLHGLTVTSTKAAQTEALFMGIVPLLSPQNTNQLVLECVAAQLPFKNGRASAAPLIGIRSNATQLLADGWLDLRSQTLQLQGRLRPRSGIHLGLSTLANQITIAGPVLQPQLTLGESGAVNLLARVGAAVLTGGASILGTALWDAATPAGNPCKLPRSKSNS